ncbi:AfsR/SARP family transcriptional regulator, partial [Streptomyces ruber]|uniref:AfsR/SARP family transcriptional regulator n=2 Tax=Streptomyces TaxID=1883 RepID=UPI0016701B3E
MDDHLASRTLRFEVLGPLRVWRNGTQLDIGPVQRQVLLATLLLHADRPVPQEELVDVLWGSVAPEHAVDLVRRHVLGLLRALEPGRPADAPSRLLSRTGTAYTLTVPPGRLDVTRYAERVERGRAARAAGDLPTAAGALHGALGLWRGPFCEGLSGPLLDRERERLTEHRLDVLEERVAVDLALGRHADVVAELAGLVREHPSRKRLRAQWTLALRRSGRRAGTPATYEGVGRPPYEEPGGAPGPAPRRPERAVPTDGPAPAADTGPAPPPVPFLLPGDVAAFTGRERQLAWLDRLTAADTASTAAPICLISGAPGVGKTALAVHWAHRARPAFPDGQLYLNLRGYDPEQPMPAGDALARLLTALGLPGKDIPLKEADRAARYRSELAGRHVLVVLDNAATAEQVRPLLPGTPTCLTVVTSRDALPGLVALDGAHRLVLGLLPTGDTHALLRRLIGPRVRAEPQAAATLA